MKIPSLPSAAGLLTATMFAAMAFAPHASAEDADRFRPYLNFRYGEMSTPWGVHDYWGIAVGANLDRHWGVELNSDLFEEFPHDASGREFGEESVITLMPQVRYRFPFWQDRIVPYVIAGVGPAFLSFNDRKPVGFYRDISTDGTTLAVAAGAGVDIFLGDQVALNIEAKYLWMDPLGVSIDGQNRDLDLSNTLLTVGLRVYFDENDPRNFWEGAEATKVRGFFGVRYGFVDMTDSRWTPSASLTPPASAVLGDLGRSGGISLGAMFGPILGAELAVDLLEPNLTYAGYGVIGEYAVRTIIPQLVLRYPLGNGRWVPYFSGGFGVAHTEYNDRKQPGDGLDVDAGGFQPAIRLGGGLEYFVTGSFSILTDLHWSHVWDSSISINGGPEESGSFAAFQIQCGFKIYFPGLKKAK